MEAAAAQHSVFGDALSALYDRDDKIIELRLLVKKRDRKIEKLEKLLAAAQKSAAATELAAAEAALASPAGGHRVSFGDARPRRSSSEDHFESPRQSGRHSGAVGAARGAGVLHGVAKASRKVAKHGTKATVGTAQGTVGTTAKIVKKIGKKAIDLTAEEDEDEDEEEGVLRNREEQILLDMFAEIDEDGGGTLDQHELESVFSRLGFKIDAEEMHEVMRVMDDNGDDEVDFEEFASWMRSDNAIAHSLRQYLAVHRPASYPESEYPDFIGIDDIDTKKKAGKGVRKAVSKKKRRFTEDGFDLDLTYVTPWMIAMGFPSEGAEAAYRNPMTEVQKFMKQRHGNKFMVYNLCDDKPYDPKKFDGLMRVFGFEDHNPPPFDLIPEFADQCDAYLRKHEEQGSRPVVAIHCKAGKGRTGLMCSVMMLRRGDYATTDEALDWFGYIRTLNGKGVTIPSQARYVHYYGRWLQDASTIPAQRRVRLMRVKVNTVPHFDPNGGCDPYFRIQQRDGLHLAKEKDKKFDSSKKGKVEAIKPTQVFFDLKCDRVPLLSGDIRLELWDKDFMSKNEKMCHMWFNTRFLPSNGGEPFTFLMQKSEVDSANKDKKNIKFDRDFSVELFFEEAPV